MGDNEQHNYNVTIGATTKANGAIAIPPQKKHVTTMMVQHDHKMCCIHSKKT